MRYMENTDEIAQLESNLARYQVLLIENRYSWVSTGLNALIDDTEYLLRTLRDAKTRRQSLGSARAHKSVK